MRATVLVWMPNVALSGLVATLIGICQCCGSRYYRYGFLNARNLQLRQGDYSRSSRQQLRPFDDANSIGPFIFGSELGAQDVKRNGVVGKYWSWEQGWCCYCCCAMRSRRGSNRHLVASSGAARKRSRNGVPVSGSQSMSRGEGGGDNCSSGSLCAIQLIGPIPMLQKS